MTDDRDPDLARRLAELDAPDHRPGFWADLRAELSDSTEPRPGDGPDLVEFGGRANSTHQGPDGDADVVEFGRPAPAPTWSRRLLPVAAAVVLLALVAVGITRSTGDGETDVATDPTLSDDPTTTNTPEGPLRPEGDPMERGIGRPIAVDPTGTFLYAAAPAPDGGFGCEGAPREVLYVERVDSGGRVLASPELPLEATGRIEMRFGPEGSVAFVTSCEGSGNTVVTGQIADNGEITKTEELAIFDLDLGRKIDRVTDFEFLSRGVLVAATRTLADDGTEHRKLYSFPTSPSEVTDLGQLDVVQVEVLDDGRLLTADTEGRLRIDSEPPFTRVDGAVLAMDVSGSVGVVATDRGVFPLDLDDGTVASESHPGQTHWVAAHPGGIVAAEGEGVGFIVRSFTLDADDRVTLGQSSGGFVLAPDASAVFYPGFPSDDGEYPLFEQRLTR